MEYIIKNILCDLDFQAEESFSCPIADRLINVTPFISKKAHSQVYLVTSLEQNMFLTLNPEDFFPPLFATYRKTNFYVSDMEKNISLLTCVKVEQNSAKDMLNVVKVAYEDNPYYFKKYVLTYNEAQLETYELKKQENVDITDLAFVQKHLSDSDLFAKYKMDLENEPFFALISEISTKIPLIPIIVNNTTSINTIEEYFEQFTTEIGINHEKSKIEKAIQTIQEISDNDVLIDMLYENWDSID